MALSSWRGPARWLPLLALVVPLAVAGCGPGTGTVAGQVSYKGTPLKGGHVTFITQDNHQSFGSEIGEDGHYIIPKVPAGPVTIAVETDSLRQQARAHKYTPPPGAPAGYKPPDPDAARRDYVPIPPQYADPDKSGLNYTVRSGSQDHAIELQ